MNDFNFHETSITELESSQRRERSWELRTQSCPIKGDLLNQERTQSSDVPEMQIYHYFNYLSCYFLIFTNFPVRGISHSASLSLSHPFSLWLKGPGLAPMGKLSLRDPRWPQRTHVKVAYTLQLIRDSTRWCISHGYTKLPGCPLPYLRRKKKILTHMGGLQLGGKTLGSYYRYPTNLAFLSRILV